MSILCISWGIFESGDFRKAEDEFRDALDKQNKQKEAKKTKQETKETNPVFKRSQKDSDSDSELHSRDYVCELWS